MTFDIISEEIAYIGGIIAPGLPLMFDYLAEKTALLPQLTPDPIKKSVGKSTEEAMRIGAQKGYCGMVRGILDGLHAEIGDFAVCATGGYARWVLEKCKRDVKIVPDLTLYGLGCIYDLNCKQSQRSSS